MLRGFLNAMDTADADEDNVTEECAARYLCEGAEEAAARGSVGAAVAQVARQIPMILEYFTLICANDIKYRVPAEYVQVPCSSGKRQIEIDPFRHLFKGDTI